MRVYISTVSSDGGFWLIHCTPKAVIGDLKATLVEHLLCGPHQVVLTFNNSHLVDEDRSLESYGIRRECCYLQYEVTIFAP